MAVEKVVWVAVCHSVAGHAGTGGFLPALRAYSGAAPKCVAGCAAQVDRYSPGPAGPAPAALAGARGIAAASCFAVDHAACPAEGAFAFPSVARSGFPAWPPYALRSYLEYHWALLREGRLHVAVAAGGVVAASASVVEGTAAVDAVLNSGCCQLQFSVDRLTTAQFGGRRAGGDAGEHGFEEERSTTGSRSRAWSSVPPPPYTTSNPAKWMKTHNSGGKSVVERHAPARDSGGREHGHLA